jgi:hypothetical protein
MCQIGWKCGPIGRRICQLLNMNLHLEGTIVSRYRSVTGALSSVNLCPQTEVLKLS